MIERGRLGRLLAAEATFTTSQVLVRDPRNHLFNVERSGHGILHWLGVHDVDALLWLAGEPIVEVQAMTANVGRQDIGVEDAVSVAFRYASGAIGTLHFVNALPRPGGEGYMRFSGERGSIKISSDGTLAFWGPGSVRDPIRVEERRYEMSAWVGYGPTSLVQIQDWLDAIRDRRDPVVTGEDLVHALEVIDAAYESAASGRRVDGATGGPVDGANTGRPRTARRSCAPCPTPSSGPTGATSGPNMSPLWYLWTGGEFWISTLTWTAKVKNLRRDPRMSVCIDDPVGGEYVTAYGRAEIVEDDTVRERTIELIRQVPRRGGRAAALGAHPGRPGDPRPASGPAGLA